jgi:hypothetical protein
MLFPGTLLIFLDIFPVESPFSANECLNEDFLPD